MGADISGPRGVLESEARALDELTERRIADEKIAALYGRLMACVTIINRAAVNGEAPSLHSENLLSDPELLALYRRVNPFPPPER